MGRLERVEHKIVEEYLFQCAISHEFLPEQTVEVKIVFVNNKFSYADYNFSGKYTREQWDILADIQLEILRIEDEKGCVE